MSGKTSDKTHYGLDKIERYGWGLKDAPGELRYLHKEDLRVHPAYQRDVSTQKVLQIAAEWSWVACGAIVVGERGGDYWVIDGQHRVDGAKRRSDITTLPCIVFQTAGAKEEASSFLDINTGRRAVSAIGKFKAMLTAGDEAALAVHSTLEALGIRAVQTANKPRDLKSIAWAVRKAGEDLKKFETVMIAAAELCHDMPIPERLIEGLWYIQERLQCGIEDKRFNARLRAVGARGLVNAASKASAYFVRGGGRTWATGMMDEINKGLRNKFELRGDHEQQ